MERVGARSAPGCRASTRWTVRVVHAEEPIGERELPVGVGHAALVLQDEHLLGGEAFEDPAQLGPVEAPFDGAGDLGPDLRARAPWVAARGPGRSDRSGSAPS